MTNQPCSRPLPTPFSVVPTNQDFKQPSQTKKKITLDLWGSDLLARKIYPMPVCVSVEISMQIHSNCMKNKKVHKSHT